MGLPGLADLAALRGCVLQAASGEADAASAERYGDPLPFCYSVREMRRRSLRRSACGWYHAGNPIGAALRPLETIRGRHGAGACGIHAGGRLLTARAKLMQFLAETRRQRRRQIS